MSKTSSHRPARAFLGRLGILAALLVAWGYAAADRSPLSLPATAHATELAVASRTDAPPPTSSPPTKSELAQLRIFNRVVLLVKEYYVDPKRVDPRKMLSAALDGVERQVAEVMVDGDEKAPKIKVTVDKVSRNFDVSNVKTFWQLSIALRDIFEFVDQNLTDRDDMPEIEYAATNGMLSTLDPHSILLKPEFFKEMKLQTRGEFGGVGFVIQMREGNLTVVKVLKGTPAQKAGLKSKDIIARIGNESTINMDLNEAVSRLRGKPGTEVNVSVLREGWSSPKVMGLTRAVINVESVESKLLADNVAYIKLKAFQGNTARDLQKELARLKDAARAKGGTLKGMVLDLRGNPGGLLDQAVQVSDLFLSEGTIVTTVGQAGTVRDERKAKAEETDIKLPLAVLVNSGSASASEIVAGAIKNNNRGVIIGRATFGKGSVQVLHDDFPDESALKLTVAQYLTPGDVSIQEIGIVPDIELIPARISAEKVDVFAPKKSMGEADLDQHFGNPDSDKAVTKRDEVVRRDKPSEEIRFMRDPPKEKPKDPAMRERPDRDDFEMDDLEGVDPDTDEIVEDYRIRFARDFVLAAPFGKRDQMLKASHAFLEERKKQESDRIQQAIEALKIPWGSTPLADAAGGQLSVTVKPTLDQKTPAGTTLAWIATATNTGTGPFLKLRAYTDSDNPYLDRREFLFGDLKPGESRSWTVNVKLPKDIMSRRDAVTFKFFADGKSKPEEYKSELSIVELAKPSFAYTWQLIDHCDACNGDGIAQPNETVDLAFSVTNIGQGVATEAFAALKNPGDESIVLTKGRVKLGQLKPGETKTGVFTFEMHGKGDKGSLQMTIGDDPTAEMVTDKLLLPVSPTGATASKLPNRAAIALGDIELHATADATSPSIAKVPKGRVLALEAKVGNLYRVKDGDIVGFAAPDDVRLTADAALKRTSPGIAATTRIVRRSEPTIRLNVDSAAGGVVTDSNHFTLSGEAASARALRDLYIFVNDKKVFFKLAANTGDPKQLKFESDFPLKPGNNTVAVIAREDKEFMERRFLVINRRDSEVVQKGK